MKRTILKRLGQIGLILGLSLGFGQAANAALNVTPVLVGSGPSAITCYARWDSVGGGVWPNNANTAANSHFVYCGQDIAGLPGSPTQAQLAALGSASLNALNTLSAANKSYFSARNVKYFIFKDVVQRYATIGQTPPSEQLGWTGSSDYYLIPPTTYMYEKSSVSPYPAFTNIGPDTLHEAGHHYQFFNGKLANSGKFWDYAAIDLTYMDSLHPGNTYRTTPAYSYYLKNYQTIAAIPKGYEELFAEEFALSPNLPTSVPAPTRVQDILIRESFKCTQAYTNAWRESSRDPIKADFDKFNTASDPNVYARCVPTPPPTCTIYGAIGGQYPIDGINAFICFTPVDTARRNSLFDTIKQMPFKTGSAPNKAWDDLKAQGVKVFYFKNATDARKYFNATAPYNSTTGLTVVEPIITSNEQCGHTSYGYKSTGQQIVIAVYDECTVTTNGVNGQISNPSLYWTATHQTGHAYNYALASKKSGSARSILPSDSGYKTLLTTDQAGLVPTAWGGWTNQQKNNHICAVFSTTPAQLFPSVIEIDSGASSGAVCDTTGTPLSPYLWTTTTTGKTPQEIATVKIPFFYYYERDLWAQEFAEYVAYIPGSVGQNYYKFSDQVIKNGSSTARFVCTRAVLSSYVSTGLPPTSLPVGICPVNPGPLN